MNSLKIYFFLSVLFFLPPVIYAQCNSMPGYSFLGQYGTHGYYMSDSLFNWQEANTLAINAGGNLVTVNNQVENDFLKSLLGENLVFIGFSDQDVEGTGAWSNGANVSIDLSYGNTDDNDFAVMNYWDGTWEMVNSYVEKKFVMELNCVIPISCLDNGITFTTQQSIDSFSITYSYCNVIKGYVIIEEQDNGNNSILNLEGLKNITTINGGLSISGNSQLLNLSGLDNLDSIGKYLFLFNNEQMNSLKGLGSLETVKGLIIQRNPQLENLNGMEKISTDLGSLNIDNNSKLNSLKPLERLKSLGGYLNIARNDSLKSLEGLDSIQFFDGSFAIENNKNLVDISSIRNIDPSSVSNVFTPFMLSMNTKLSECSNSFICGYLSSGATSFIASNNTGCNSALEINENCFVSRTSNSVLWPLAIFPNPASSVISFNPDLDIINISMYNQVGQLVLQSNDKELDVSLLPIGLYFVKAALHSGVAIGKFLKE